VKTLTPAPYRAKRDCQRPRSRGAAGRGVGKVEPGSEKILDVGLNFKTGICPAHPRPDVGLEKLRALCEAYVKSSHLVIKASSVHMRSINQAQRNIESIDAQNRADEITS